MTIDKPQMPTRRGDPLRHQDVNQFQRGTRVSLTNSGVPEQLTTLGRHPVPSVKRSLIVMFVLDDAISAAAAPLTGATQATATILIPDQSNPATATVPQDLVESDRQIEVVNRDPDASAAADTLGTALRINNEWLVLSLGCSAITRS
jgi:hypothetical protein